jgi:hypothetical protein
MPQDVTQAAPAARSPDEQAAQDVAEAAPAALGALPATAERLGEEGQHEWRQDRQRLLEEPRVEPPPLPSPRPPSVLTIWSTRGFIFRRP